MNKYYHNSRTSDYIDIKLGPVTNIEERKKNNLKKYDDDVMSANCNVIVICSIYGQFGTIWKPDSGRIDTALTQLSNYCFD